MFLGRREVPKVGNQEIGWITKWRPNKVFHITIRFYLTFTRVLCTTRLTPAKVNTKIMIADVEKSVRTTEVIMQGKKKRFG